MPNPPPKQTDIALSLTGARCRKFALTDYGHTNKSKVPEDNYEFSLSIILSSSNISQQIQVTLDSQLFEKKNAQLKLELAEIQVSCSFFIQNFNDLISRDPKGDLKIPDPLLQWCSNITLGVARGMFALKLEKTLYANALLPLVDTKLLRTITTGD
jgi:hypothetical protein